MVLKRRRRHLRAERGTQVLAAAAVAVTGGALLAEWRRLRARRYPLGVSSRTSG